MKHNPVPASAGIVHKGQRGFTLVEMAVVLVIIATVTGMAIASGISVISAAKLSATNQKMAAIDQALMAFRLANNRLPCPADLTQNQGSSTYGTEDNVTSVLGVNNPVTNCGSIANGIFVTANSASTAWSLEGGVPTIALGLPNDMMYDGWGSRFRYAVDASMTVAGAFTATQIGAVSGAISVYAGPTYPAAVANARTTGAIYALISHGPNKHGGVTSNYTSTNPFFNASSNNQDELANCHCTAAGAYNASGTVFYVQEAPYTYQSIGKTDPSYNYDDIVTFKERWQMQVPGDVAGISPPRVFIADSGNNRIDVYDLMGNHLFNIGSSGTTTGCAAPPVFSGPYGVAADKYGNIWVADTTNNRIQKISVSASGATIGCANELPSGTVGSGNVVQSLSGTTNNPIFNGPKGIAVDNSNFIWVVDSGNFRALRFDAQNPPNWLTSIGANAGGCTNNCCNPDMHGQGAPVGGYVASCATTPGNSGFGTGAQQAAIDANNNIWVADPGNNRVEEFNLQLANITPTIAGLSAPKGVAIDASSGNIWVADTGNKQVQGFTSTGTSISYGNFTGAFGNLKFTGPQGVAVDPMGNIWVADTANWMIYKCTMPTPSQTAVQIQNATNCTVVGGGGGAGANQFNAPTAIAITAR